MAGGTESDEYLGLSEESAKTEVTVCPGGAVAAYVDLGKKPETMTPDDAGTAGQAGAGGAGGAAGGGDEDAGR